MHWLELARDCDPILGDPQLHHDWWAEFRLSLTARRGCQKGKGLHLGARAPNNACSLNGGLFHQDRKLEWKQPPSSNQARLQTPAGGTQLPG